MTKRKPVDPYESLGMFGLHNPEYSEKAISLIAKINAERVTEYHPVNAYAVTIATYADGKKQHFTSALSAEGLARKLEAYNLANDGSTYNSIQSNAKKDEYDDRYLEFLVHGEEEFVFSSVETLFKLHGIEGAHREKLNRLMSAQKMIKEHIQSTAPKQLRM